MPYEVSAEGAIRFVRQRRAAGGCLPAFATAFLLLLAIGFIQFAMKQPAAWLLVAACGAPGLLLLRRGLQTRAKARVLEEIAGLRQPLSAALVKRVLLVGTTGTPVDKWCAVQVTAAEEQRIRGLALPAATLVRR